MLRDLNTGKKCSDAVIMKISCRLDNHQLVFKLDI